MGLRKHCNPLTFRGKVAKPDWEKIFPKKQPMEIDIGSGRGRFLLERASAEPNINFIGLEVREAFFDIAQKKLSDYKGDNLYFARCNANQSLADFFEPEKISRIHIYFPDPWFKRRHHKRRIVTSELIHTSALLLKESGELHVTSDVEQLAMNMLDIIEAEPLFENRYGKNNFASDKPFMAVTNWEAHLIKVGKPYKRMIFIKQSKNKKI